MHQILERGSYYVQALFVQHDAVQRHIKSCLPYGYLVVTGSVGWNTLGMTRCNERLTELPRFAYLSLGSDSGSGSADADTSASTGMPLCRSNCTITSLTSCLALIQVFKCHSAASAACQRQQQQTAVRSCKNTHHNKHQLLLIGKHKTCS